MLKLRKKLLLPILAFVAIAGVALGIYFATNVNQAYAADATTESLYIEGAQVRVIGDRPGLRFVGRVDWDDFNAEFVSAESYGMLLAFGEVDTADVTIGATVGGKSVKDFNIPFEEMAASDWTYRLTVYNIPEEYYGQPMTARMYAKLNNGTVVYGAEAETRNLADVSRTLYNITPDDELATPSDNLIKKVALACRVKVTDVSGSVKYYSNFIYQNNEENPKLFELQTAPTGSTLDLVRGTYNNKLYLYEGMTVNGAYKDVAINASGARSTKSKVVGESIITQAVLQTRHNTVINGLKLTGDVGYYLRGSYGTATIQYCNITYTGMTGITEAAISGGTEPTGQTHSNTVIDNCYFKSTQAGAADIALASKINNITVTNCTFDSVSTSLMYDATNGSDYGIQIKVPSANSKVIIKDNTFKHQGAYHVICIGEGLSAKRVYSADIINNELSTDTAVALGGHGIQLTWMATGSVANIIHNTMTTSTYFNAVVVSSGSAATSTSDQDVTVNLKYNKFYWAGGPMPDFRTSTTNKYTRIAICSSAADVEIQGNYFSNSTSTYAFTNMTANNNIQGAYFKTLGSNPLKADGHYASTVTKADVAYNFYTYTTELAEYVAANGPITGLNATYGGAGNANIQLYIPSFLERHDQKIFIANGALHYAENNVTATQAEAAGWENITPLEIVIVNETLQDAVVQMAYAYLDVAEKTNYDEYYNRRYLNAAPEQANAEPLILDCSSFVNNVYKQTIGQNATTGSVTTKGFMDYAAANASAPVVPFYYEVTGSETESEKTDVLNGVQGTLQKGDLLVYRQNNNSAGHVMLYIGNDEFIHSTGVSYKMNPTGSSGSAPVDPNAAYEADSSNTASEANGSVQLMASSEVFSQTGARYLFGSKNIDHICVIRPLVNYASSDLTATAEARMALGRAQIYRLAMANGEYLKNYSSVYPGSEIYISIGVVNCGGDSNPLQPFTITDTIPAGTVFDRLVGITTGYNEDADATISWTRDTALKTDVTRTYVVKVRSDLAPGTVIRLAGGDVNGIPVNDITLTVAADKRESLDDAIDSQVTLGAASSAGTFDLIHSVYNELGYEKFGSMTPEDVFASFPNMFQDGALKSSYPYYSIAVKGLFGGYQLIGKTAASAWQLSNTRVRVVKKAYLMQGDVLVVADDSKGTTEYNAYLFDGNNLIGTDNGTVSYKTSARPGYETADMFLEQLEAYKYFIVLRPSIDPEF